MKLLSTQPNRSLIRYQQPTYIFGERERERNKLARTNRHLWIRFFVSPNGRFPSAQRLDLPGDEPAPPARLRRGRRRHGPGPRQRDRVFVLLLHVPAPGSFRRLPERGPAPDPGPGRPRLVVAASRDGDGEGARDSALAVDEAVPAAERADGGGGGRGGRAGAGPRARAVGAEPEEAVAEAVRAHAAARQGRVPPAAPVVAGHRR
jgi:hypothetical protein